MPANLRGLRKFSEDAPQRHRVRREGKPFLELFPTLPPQRLGGKSSEFFGCGSAALGSVRWNIPARRLVIVLAGS
jgi:hypothetical protein